MQQKIANPQPAVYEQWLELKTYFYIAKVNDKFYKGDFLHQMYEDEICFLSFLWPILLESLINKICIPGFWSNKIYKKLILLFILINFPAKLNHRDSTCTIRERLINKIHIRKVKRKFSLEVFSCQPTFCRIIENNSINIVINYSLNFGRGEWWLFFTENKSLSYTIAIFNNLPSGNPIFCGGYFENKM